MLYLEFIKNRQQSLNITAAIPDYKFILLSPGHQGPTFGALNLIAWCSCLMSNAVTTVRAYTFTTHAKPGSAHAGFSTTLTEATACSRPFSPRSATISSGHNNHLLFGIKRPTSCKAGPFLLTCQVLLFSNKRKSIISNPSVTYARLHGISVKTEQTKNAYCLTGSLTGIATHNNGLGTR